MSFADRINSQIETYINIISEKFSLDEDELKNIWYGNSESSKTEKKTKEVKTKTSIKSSSSSSEGCAFILTRGDRKGDPCGKKCASTSEYCSTHNNQLSKKKDKEVKSSVPNVKPLASRQKEKILKAIPNSPYFSHPPTGLVFEEKVMNDEKKQYVIGKLNGTDIVELNESDKELCQAQNFKISSYPESLRKESTTVTTKRKVSVGKVPIGKKSEADKHDEIVACLGLSKDEVDSENTESENIESENIEDVEEEAEDLE